MDLASGPTPIVGSSLMADLLLDLLDAALQRDDLLVDRRLLALERGDLLLQPDILGLLELLLDAEFLLHPLDVRLEVPPDVIELPLHSRGGARVLVLDRLHVALL